MIVVSKDCNIKMKLFSKIKIVLILFYIRLLLFKFQYNLIFFTAKLSSSLIIKKFFYRFFCLNKGGVSGSCFLFLKSSFIKYYNFYEKNVSFDSLFFIKYNIHMLKTVDFYFFNKIYFIKARKINLKNFIIKYCRNVFNFKNFKQFKIFYNLKRHFLFFKKSTFKHKSPFYLDKLNLIYNEFFRILLKKSPLFSINNDIENMANSLFFKVTFFNFLKSLNTLDFFYKKHFYNIYLKKIKYNLYITVTNRKGDVLFSNSSGKVGLLKKKEKKSMFAVEQVTEPIIKDLLQLNIFFIKNFFCSAQFRQFFLSVKNLFLRSGITVDNAIIFNSKPHNFYYKKLKKRRRI